MRRLLVFVVALAVACSGMILVAPPARTQSHPGIVTLCNDVDKPVRVARSFTYREGMLATNERFVTAGWLIIEPNRCAVIDVERVCATLFGMPVDCGGQLKFYAEAMEGPVGVQSHWGPDENNRGRLCVGATRDFRFDFAGDAFPGEAACASLGGVAVDAIVRDTTNTDLELRLTTSDGRLPNVPGFVAGVRAGGQIWEVGACPPNFTAWAGYSQISCACPPGPQRGTVYGTDIYAAESSICAAAVHSGRLTSLGGELDLASEYNAPGSLGSTRNGVTSEAARSARIAFRVTAARPLRAETARRLALTAPTAPNSTDIANAQVCPSDLLGQSSPNAMIVCRCEPVSSLGAVWGGFGGLYTADSHICTAAVHAGAISKAHGGVIIARAAPGQSSYSGSTAHGVRTSNWGAYQSSYLIEATAPLPPEPPSVVAAAPPPVALAACPRDMTGYRGQNTAISCECGARTPSSSVWGGGDGYYTDDSSLCAAAVHAGMVRAGEAGRVTVRWEAGRSTYRASTANNVTTRSYGPYSGSFRFQGRAVSAVRDPNEVDLNADPSSPCPQTLRVRLGTEAQLACTCPAGSANGGAWGGVGGYYTAGSHICTAAAHAGAFNASVGGLVTVQIAPGQQFYRGSYANGVQTYSRSQFQASIIVISSTGEPFINAAAGRTAATAEECPNYMTNYRGRQQGLLCVCPPGTYSRGIYGGDGYYTDNSFICTAAVHAGVISANGGAILATPAPGRTNYVGSVSNGVTSLDYGAWDGSFTVSAPPR